MKDVLLSLESVSKYYPGVAALKNMSLDIYKGETLAIAGENGAGKSTLIKVLAGAISPSSGRINFEGTEYSALNPHTAQRIGISVIYQEFNLLNTLSVAENVFAGQLPSNCGLYNKKEAEKRAKEIFNMMDVDIDVTTPVGNLSVAYMQLVEIAKSLSRNVKLLIMDEPTAPLTTKETDRLFRIVRSIQEKGTTIIFITHRLDEIFEIADRVMVMRDGEKISVDSVKDITKSNLVQNMVGRTISETFPKCDKVIGETVLEVKKLCGNGVKNINFELHKGEILGFGGLVGSGRTEIIRVLFGADAKDAGEINLFGEEVSINSPRDALKNKIALLTEDRKQLGLMLGQSIGDNISLPNLKNISKLGVLNKNKEKSMTKEQISSLKIICYSPSQLAGTLSGGNQQKVVLAKWLATDTEIFIFDEPTRGIDVGAKLEIYNIMNSLCENGKSIIMISSEMDELINMSDRILVLYEGQQMGILEKPEFAQDRILALASGERI